MKKILLTLYFLALTPLSAFAAINYTRTPTGSNPTSPLILTIQADDFQADIENGQQQCNDGVNQADCLYWSAKIYGQLGEDYNNYWGNECISSSVLNHSFVVNVPVGLTNALIGIQGAYTLSDCENALLGMGDGDTGNGWDLFSDNFTIVAGKSGVLFGRSGESQQAIQGGGSALAAVGLVSTNAFTSVFPYLMLSVGVFLAFYVIQKIAMLWGDRMKPESSKIDPEKSKWTAEGVSEHDYKHWRKKARSRQKRGLKIE